MIKTVTLSYFNFFSNRCKVIEHNLPTFWKFINTQAHIIVTLQQELSNFPTINFYSYNLRYKINNFRYEDTKGQCINNEST